MAIWKNVKKKKGDHLEKRNNCVRWRSCELQFFSCWRTCGWPLTSRPAPAFGVLPKFYSTACLRIIINWVRNLLCTVDLNIRYKYDRSNYGVLKKIKSSHWRKIYIMCSNYVGEINFVNSIVYVRYFYTFIFSRKLKLSTYRLT